MPTERQPHVETAATSDAQPAEPAREPLNEAQRWWDEQMAEARRSYPKVIEPLHPRPMTREKAKAWLAESEQRIRSIPWKPWSGWGTTASDDE